jgi:hypothetical protein
MAAVSDTTIWRWLSEDAIRPWQHRCWIFPRDEVTRRATVLRPGHFDALHEDLHLLAQREHLRPRCPMPGRRKASERAGLPVSREVEHGEPHEEHRADPLHSREKAHH